MSLALDIIICSLLIIIIIVAVILIFVSKELYNLIVPYCMAIFLPITLFYLLSSKASTQEMILQSVFTLYWWGRVAVNIILDKIEDCSSIDTEMRKQQNED